MPNDATPLSRASTVVQVTTENSLQAYEIVQTPLGIGGVYNSATATSAGSVVLFNIGSTYTVVKTAGFVALAGFPAYWDHSANAVNYKKVNDRDFFLGTFSADALNAATQCDIVFGVKPQWDIDLQRDAFISAKTGTVAAGGFGYPVQLGGASIFELDATSEIQKIDLLSVNGFSPNANPMVQIIVRVLSDGAGSEPDFNIGIANATHGTDADSITEACFFHLDGNSTNISAASRDGTTTVAITDTTLDYTEGSTFTSLEEWWIDARNPADIQLYRNGSLVLDATAFKLNAATGPLFLLAHLEKSSSASVYKIAVDEFRCKLSEQ